MHRIPSLLMTLALPLIAAAAPPSREALLAMASKSACEQPTPGHVIFAGDSTDLGDCLAKVTDGEIRELRITSSGGDALPTLRLAEKYRGHLELMIVDGLCAASCANYLLPAAQRVRVNEHSYVLLHGSMSPGDFEAQKARIESELREKSPGTSDDDITRLLESARRELTAAAPLQKAFAQKTLACGDWLAPDSTKAGHSADPSWFLVVTPEMARRCLKTARVEAFWAPEPEDQFAPELGFHRARR
jgi:hypothetical protein